MFRTRALILLSLVALVLAGACSMNRVLPESMDAEAMEVEVRSAIMAVAPGKTMDVDVTEGGRVTIKGHADSAAQRTAIINRVRDVKGVTSVDGGEIHVE